MGHAAPPEREYAVASDYPQYVRPPPADAAGDTNTLFGSTLALGRYGSLPSNLIIHRPYHLTYELLDKDPSSNSFSRLRVVPASELHADVLAEENPSRQDSAVPEDNILSATDGVEFSLVDNETGAVVVRSNREIIDDNARQTLTWQEIEALKRDGTDSGQELIAKLMLSHTGMDQKTTFSMAKYKLLKEKKFLRRFTVLPVDVSGFGNFWINEREGTKVMDMREEMVGLVGCWGNVHYSENDQGPVGDLSKDSSGATLNVEDVKTPRQPEGTRYLVVDDTSGLLVAALAERMGMLYPNDQKEPETPKAKRSAQDVAVTTLNIQPAQAVKRDHEGNPKDETSGDSQPQPAPDTQAPRPRQHPPRKSDFHIPFSTTNTMTLVHTSGQPNLTSLNYWGFDSTNPSHPPHPLSNHLLPLSWLQLLEPEYDSVYATEPPAKTAEEIASWKPNRRGNYHRKRRRWARTRYVADSARAGGFSGLVVASTMDPVSVLRPLLPLVAGGAPVAVYSPTVEPLAKLVDCFSVARRAAFVGKDQPPETVGKSAEELERWEGTEEFPINPTLLLGVQLHSSRARKWQVLPMRTHPVMTARGGAEGYVFTAWRAKPAEGRIAARGKFQKKQKTGASSATDGTPAETGTPVDVEA